MNMPHLQLQTLDDFKEFFRQIPEDQWCATPRHSGLRHSAAGHIELAYPFTASEVFETLGNYVFAIGNTVHINRDNAMATDKSQLGQHVLDKACGEQSHVFPFNSPKLRVLSLCDKLKDAHTKAVVNALQSSDGDLPEFSGL